MQLNNLIHLPIITLNLLFNDFEKYLMKLFPELRVLTITLTSNCIR